MYFFVKKQVSLIALIFIVTFTACNNNQTNKVDSIADTDVSFSLQPSNAATVLKALYNSPA